MDDAARVRHAAREALADVDPRRLRELLDARVEEVAATPGVLARTSARLAHGHPEPDSLDRRAAGVQLIYAGLSLTRTLARDSPWKSGESADMDVLVADVLVARGFYLLARTEAAGHAVETVRSFGHDETVRESDPDAADGTLEADVFELAIVAGVSAAGDDPPSDARAFATDLARTLRGETTLRDDLPERAVAALEDLVDGDRPSDAAPDEAWARSGATDR